MLKPIIQIYPVLPTENEEEREQKKPIGRDRGLYQEVLQGWHDIVRAADELGIWGAATIEHHFWSEGYEVGPSPGVLDAYWAAITKNIRVGQLGYVMSTQNPIRVAEETAIIDHLSNGRSFVGFARGYQSRWTNVLGQQYGTTATKSPSAAAVNPSTVGAGFSTKSTSDKDVTDDQHNRRVFEENIEILQKAWTQDAMSHNGSQWQIPYPYETGVKDWQLANAGITQRFGADGEVDDEGAVRKVSVCPAPLQQPHPPVFVSGSGSPETIEYNARKGFIPVYFTNIETAGPLGERYRSVAKEAGYNWRKGENQCLVRWVQFGKTDQDAYDAVTKYDLDIWKNFYAAMGRRKVVGNDIMGSLRDSGLFTMGSVDSVRKQLVEQWKILPAEYFCIVYHYAQMPKDAVIESMEIFQKHIRPALEEVIHESRKEG